MSRTSSNQYIGRPEGVPYFGRTYQLFFYDKTGLLVHKIVSDESNQWSGLKIEFDLTQNFGFVNQAATINIYNLSGATKRLIENAAIVTLYAGYQLNFGFLYQGNIVNVYDLRQQPDYILQLICLDYQRQYLPVSLLIPEGTTIANAVKMFAGSVQDVQFSLKNMYNLPDATTTEDIHFPQMEYTQAMNKLGDLLGLRIWIKNAQIFAIPINAIEPSDNSEIIEIDYTTGMIGSPTFDLANSGVMVTTLLNNRLVPGNLIQIKTQNPQVQVNGNVFEKFDQPLITRGQWIVYSSQHKGCNREDSWTTFVQAYAFSPLGTNVL